MENVKYIPGDLVKSDNNPNIQWRIADVSTNKKGDTLYRVRAVEDSDVIAYLWKKQITAIPLTSRILEANGGKYKREAGLDTYIFGENITNRIIVEINKDKEFCVSISDSIYINLKIKYCHEFQHLLFAFNLPMDLKV